MGSISGVWKSRVRLAVAGTDLLWEKNTTNWLVAGADSVWEKSTTGWLADKPAEQSVYEWLYAETTLLATYKGILDLPREFLYSEEIWKSCHKKNVIIWPEICKGSFPREKIWLAYCLLAAKRAEFSNAHFCPSCVCLTSHVKASRWKLVNHEVWNWMIRWQIITWSFCTI